jgi:hypothetical protein
VLITLESFKKSSFSVALGKYGKEREVIWGLREFAISFGISFLLSQLRLTCIPYLAL